MSPEEEEKAYRALDQKRMHEKKAEVMLHMCRRKSLEKEDLEVFREVKSMFNETELVYMSCCFIGMELKRALENPMFKMLIQLLRAAEEAAETNDKEKQEDVLKQVMDILKN